MLINFWKNDNIRFYCMNGHEEPIPMEVKFGSSPFYACPKYMLMDTEHPDGHMPDEPMCTNQLSFSDAQDIVFRFSEIIEEDIVNDTFTDYTGYVFRYKNIEVTVLLYDDKPCEDGVPSVLLGILNKSTIRR